MSRSLITKAGTLGLIALFHVAMFEDVVMLLCAPMAGSEQVATAPSDGPDHHAVAGHDHHAMAHGIDKPASAPESGDGGPVPQHDHGSCNFCCSHGPSDIGRLPSLQLLAEAPALDVAPAEYVELHLSPTVSLNTLPNPPPVA